MIQHLTLLKKAEELGIQHKDLSDLIGKPAAVLEHNNQSEIIIDGVPSSWINLRSQYYCDKKQLTKDALQKLGVPYPKSIIFRHPDEVNDIHFANTPNIKYVCKPLDGTNGVGVVMDIENQEMVEEYFKNNKHLDEIFLIEEQAPGEDLRLQVIDKKIIAACIRKPAYVVGDGVKSLEELIQDRQAVMKTQNPNNFLEIDSITQDLLIEQGILLTDIPKPKQQIQLKKISNMAQGGIAIDVTEDINPIYQIWVTKICNFLDTGYLGIDIMTTDYQKEAASASKFLELNARADWLHHTFSQRKRHDLAGIILKALF